MDEGNKVLVAMQAFLDEIPEIVLCQRIFSDEYVFLVLTEEPRSDEEMVAWIDGYIRSFIEEKQKKYPDYKLRISCGICPVLSATPMESIDNQALCEGVERADQCDFLLQAGCQLVQGYYFSKPVPPENFYQTYSEQGGCYTVPEGVVLDRSAVC